MARQGRYDWNRRMDISDYPEPPKKAMPRQQWRALKRMEEKKGRALRQQRDLEMRRMRIEAAKRRAKSGQT